MTENVGNLLNQQEPVNNAMQSVVNVVVNMGFVAQTIYLWLIAQYNFQSNKSTKFIVPPTGLQITELSLIMGNFAI